MGTIIINKRINNNVIIIDDGEQFIAFGKGIGFQKHKGDEVDEAVIEKRFYAPENIPMAQVASTMMNASPKEIELITEVISMVKEKIPELETRIFFSLLEHLNFAIKRLEQENEMVSPLEWEVKKFYPMEYELGKQAVVKINNGLDITLPPSEAFFFALHFINGQLNAVTGEEAFNLTKATNDIIKQIKYFYKKNFDESSISYNRLVTHLKYFLMRLVRNEDIDLMGRDFINPIFERCPQELQCVQLIAKYLKDTYGWDMTNTDRMYLVLHLNKIKGI
ncbi:PRD domain-containing protein [Erwinia sp. CPCC 100877]|nr:PRD domain-containing protein [Erwinia sp. CPCC 100877]